MERVAMVQFRKCRTNADVVHHLAIRCAVDQHPDGNDAGPGMHHVPTKAT